MANVQGGQDRRWEGHSPWGWGWGWGCGLAGPLARPGGTAAPVPSCPHVSRLGPVGPDLPVWPRSVPGYQGPSGSGGPEEGTAGFLHPYTGGPYGMSQRLGRRTCWGEGCGEGGEHKDRDSQPKRSFPRGSSSSSRLMSIQPPLPAPGPPAPLAKQEEKDTEDDAGDPDVDANDDACGGHLVGGLPLPAVTRWAQGCWEGQVGAVAPLV